MGGCGCVGAAGSCVRGTSACGVTAAFAVAGRSAAVVSGPPARVRRPDEKCGMPLEHIALRACGGALGPARPFGARAAQLDRQVAAALDHAGSATGGAAVCRAQWDRTGAFEVACLGGPAALLVGPGGVRPVPQAVCERRRRFSTYLGSGRCSAASVARYTGKLTDAYPYLVLMSADAHASLPAELARALCLGAAGPQAAARALARAAYERGCLGSAAVVVVGFTCGGAHARVGDRSEGRAVRTAGRI